MNLKLKKNRLALLTFLLLFPLPAYAHNGIGQTMGFVHGATHPFTGWDHILAMVAVGIWASQIGGKGIWAIPATFVGMMSLGSLFGAIDIQVPFFEVGIAMSVLILGVLIATTRRLPLVAGTILVGLFAVFHGYAHGEEMPGTAPGLPYGMGFALATTLLHLCGIGLGSLSQKMDRLKVVRYTGGAIAMGGVYSLAFCIWG